MRFDYFLVLLLVAFVASVQGLANDDNAVHAIKTSSNHAIVNGHTSRRNLKGSITENAATDEERGPPVSGIATKLSQNSDDFVKVLEKSPTFINAVKTNPSLATMVQKDQVLAQVLTKNHILIKELDNPVITNSLRDALKNPAILKSLSESKDVQKIIAALPRVELTPKRIEKIGETLAKSPTVSRGISDEGQQLTAWGAAIVGTIIIVLIGIYINHKT